MPQSQLQTSIPIINMDLKQERHLATLNSEDFAIWWYGGKEKLEKRRALEKLFFDDKTFDDQEHIAFMSHKQLYEHTVVKATKFLSKLRAWHEREEQKSNKNSKSDIIQMLRDFRLLLSGTLGTAIFQQNFPLRLHYSMFVTAILGHATREQLDIWLQKAFRMDGIIGTYAQTELGHGTFLRGLETRADYDIEREEFVLNSPTLTSYKWWPGGLGQTANMVILMAQLYIKGKHYGLHPFLVRIRNEETHEPEPGIEVGEIGPKLGVNGVNNGFLGLKNVRIPRMQMLMKNNQVLADGTFVKGSEPLLTYGTMVYVRVVIVKDAAFYLLQAATIATRYSLVRRQSPIEPNQAEPKIIEHLTQQVKIFPQIAKGIFYQLAADRLWSMYQTVIQELDAGNRRNLPELHALSCCLKALCTHEATAGIEILRKACGGHGYLSFANFDQIYTATAAMCIYEGENTVLLLQTSRFLIKNYIESLKRKVMPKSLTYFRMGKNVKFSNDLNTLIRLLESTALELTHIAFEEQRAKKKKFSEAMASNLTGPKLTQAATMHGRAFLTRTAFEEINRLKKQLKPELHKTLTILLEIFILHTFLESLGDVLRCNVISSKQIAILEERYEKALTAFRPNAIAVVDGFDFHDRVLGSVLGCYDGRVYERLMEEAKKSPLNQESVNHTFHTHLKPLMQGKL